MASASLRVLLRQKSLALLGMTLGCNLAFGATAVQVAYSGVRIVDYYDQYEIAPPRVGALETLVGHQLTPAQVPSGSVERPHRLLVRVSFTTDTDLIALAVEKKSTITAMSSFCGTAIDYTSLGSPTVYYLGEPIYSGDSHAKNGLPKGSKEYYFFVNVARPPSPKSKPPQRGYDLEHSPEDICFHLMGAGSWWFQFRSNVATIPKEALTQAFAAVPAGATSNNRWRGP